jgi:hypothetical protein
VIIGSIDALLPDVVVYYTMSAMQYRPNVLCAAAIRVQAWCRMCLVRNTLHIAQVRFQLAALDIEAQIKKEFPWYEYKDGIDLFCRCSRCFYSQLARKLNLHVLFRSNHPRPIFIPVAPTDIKAEEVAEHKQTDTLDVPSLEIINELEDMEVQLEQAIRARIEVRLENL